MNRKTFLSSLAMAPIAGKAVMNPEGDFKFKEGQKVWFWDCTNGGRAKGAGYKGTIREGVVEFDKWAYIDKEGQLILFYTVNGISVVELDIFDNKEDANRAFIKSIRS